MRVPVPSSHFTKLARTLACSRRRIEESEEEGSASRPINRGFLRDINLISKR